MRLDLGDRLPVATDMISMRLERPGFVSGRDDVPPGVGDGRLELLPDTSVDHPHDALALLHKPAGVVNDRARSGRPPDRRRPRRARCPRRAGRTPRRRHDGRAPSHERRPALASARPSALRGGQGLRGGRRRLTVRRCATAAGRRRRARGRPYRSRRGPAPGPSRIELTLHEGRKHQVKRMCEAVGHPVVSLHRSRYATLTLDGLEPGEWRELSDEEVQALRKLSA